MIKFGTGGWRAVIADEFTFQNVRLLSQAVAYDIKDMGCCGEGIVIGYDSRFLSDEFAKTVAQVMAANGIKVFFINRVSPTPMVMFSVRELNTPYGIIVTASHNPPQYNGIKIVTRGGRDADLDVTKRLEGILAARLGDCNLTVDTMDFRKAVDAGLIKYINPVNEFIDSIISMLNVDVIKQRNLNILMDPMYGAAKTTLQMLLSSLRCNLDVIHDRYDANFGGRMPSPTSEALSTLKNRVVEKKYDLGVATDGDADRLGVISDKGEYIHPNQIMMLLYYYLLKYKKEKGGVVRNLMTTHILDKIAADFGEEVYEVPVGFKHISGKVSEKNALIGGESSGGLMVRGHILGKDGIYASGLMVEMLCMTGKSVSELMDEIYSRYGEYCFIEKNIALNPDVESAIRNKVYVEKAYPEYDIEIEKISYMDGLKIYFKNGWISARFSGTEPLVRIFAEMPDESQLQYVVGKMSEFIGVGK